jgi:hypothetical protein
MNKHNLNPTQFDLVEIESIELIGDTDTIDITVDDTHMFFANGVYSHNSGAEQDVITGTSIAGSFSKLMTADFVVSLSRKIDDKLAGTGRWHVIKNRFGPDGMTFPSKANFSNGQILIYNDNSVDGQNTQKEMKSGESLVRKNLLQKYKEVKGDIGF